MNDSQQIFSFLATRGLRSLLLVLVVVSAGTRFGNSQNPLTLPLEPLSPWHYEIVDSVHGVLHASLAFDSSNTPHIAYFGQGALRYAYKSGASWEIEIVVDNIGATAPVLVLDSADKPHILYSSANGIHYASWTGLSWDIQTIDGQYGSPRSLVLDSAGRPHALYTIYDGDPAIIYARWTGSDWERQLVETVSSGSLALDANDRPHISYAIGSVLSYAFYNGTIWLTETVVEHDYSVSSTNIALDPAGYPHISYLAKNIEYASWTGDSWVIEVVDTDDPEITLNSPSLDLDPAGNPHLAYQSLRSSTYSLKYAHFANGSWVTQSVSKNAGPYLYPFINLDTVATPCITFYNYYAPAMLYTCKSSEVWSTGTITGSGSSVQDSVIAIDPAGNPHLSYYSWNGSLGYAHWTGLNWDNQTVSEGGHESIAIDSSGNPHISYYSFANQSLQYAYWTGTTWHIETVNSGGNIGTYTSLALDSADNPHISYYGNGNLKYASWTGTAWQIQTVDSQGDVGWQTSLALDSAGNPHISYYHQTNNGSYLKYAHWTGTTWVIQSLGMSYGEIKSSVAVDLNDNPHIVYNGLKLFFLSWTGNDWQIETIDTDGWGPSLKFDTQNNPHFSYCASGNLRYATYLNGAWGIQTLETVCSSNASLDLNSEGMPYISFVVREGVIYELRYAIADSWPLPTLTPTATTTGTPTNTPSPTSTNTPTASTTPSPTETHTPTLTPVTSATPTPTITTPSPTETHTPTLTPVNTPTASATPTPTGTPQPAGHLYLPLILNLTEG